MIKKHFLSVLTIILVLTNDSLYANEPQYCTCNTTDLSITEKIIIGGLLGGTIIVAAPYILSAGSIIKIAVATKSLIAAGITYSSTSTIGKFGLCFMVIETARPHILQTAEEKLSQLLKEKDSMPEKSKADFINCLKTNKYNPSKNIFGRPVACEDAALFYALNSSISELHKRTEAFNNGTCFCG